MRLSQVRYLHMPMAISALRYRRTGLGDTVYGDYSSDDGSYSGGYVIDSPPWWSDTIGQAIGVVGKAITPTPAAPQYSPYGAQPYPTQPRVQQPQSQFSLGSVGTGGVSISPTTILLGALVVGLVFFGKSRH